MYTYKKGLLIGRFQPLHFGHIYLIKEALKQVEELSIVIGSTNIIDENNLYSFELRKQMIETFINKESLQEKIKNIIPIEDVPDDNKWLVSVIKKCGKFDLVISNNDWVTEIFKKAGYKILEINFYKRHLYEGKKIRSLMSSHKHWQTLVPSYIKDLIQ